MGPEAVTDSMIKERVRASVAFLVMVLLLFHDDAWQYFHHDESAVLYSPSSGCQKVSLAQWRLRSTFTGTKQVVLAFFYSKGLIYTNHWDNAQVRTATTVTDWMKVRQIKTEWKPAAFARPSTDGLLNLPRVKTELAGLTLTQKTFKKKLRGAVQTITMVDFAKAFHLVVSAQLRVYSYLQRLCPENLEMKCPKYYYFLFYNSLCTWGIIFTLWPTTPAL